MNTRIDSPVPVVDGQLYALGGSVELDGRVSWYPPSWRGYTSSNSYLLVEDDAALLIDTGLTVHEEELLAQLATLPRPSLSVLHTRIVELDGCCNTAAVMRRFPVEHLYAPLTPRLFVHFRHEFDEEPHTEDGPAWSREQAVDEQQLTPGDDVSVGASEHGRDRLHIVPPVLRLLGTHWPYDRRTKTLFTSESFGHSITDSPGGPRVLRPDEDDTKVDQVSEYLYAKFDWLLRAELAPVRSAFANQLAELDIEIIAPQYGRVLSGRDLVARHVDLILQALDQAHERAAA